MKFELLVLILHRVGATFDCRDSPAVKYGSARHVPTGSAYDYDPNRTRFMSEICPFYLEEYLKKCEKGTTVVSSARDCEELFSQSEIAQDREGEDANLPASTFLGCNGAAQDGTVIGNGLYPSFGFSFCVDCDFATSEANCPMSCEWTGSYCNTKPLCHCPWGYNATPAHGRSQGCNSDGAIACVPPAWNLPRLAACVFAALLASAVMLRACSGPRQHHTTVVSAPLMPTDSHDQSHEQVAERNGGGDASYHVLTYAIPVIAQLVLPMQLLWWWPVAYPRSIFFLLLLLTNPGFWYLLYYRWFGLDGMMTWNPIDLLFPPVLQHGHGLSSRLVKLTRLLQGMRPALLIMAVYYANPRWKADMQCLALQLPGSDCNQMAIGFAPAYLLKRLDKSSWLESSSGFGKLNGEQVLVTTIASDIVSWMRRPDGCQVPLLQGLVSGECKFDFSSYRPVGAPKMVVWMFLVHFTFTILSFFYTAVVTVQSGLASCGAGASGQPQVNPTDDDACKQTRMHLPSSISMRLRSLIQPYLFAKAVMAFSLGVTLASIVTDLTTARQYYMWGHYWFGSCMVFLYGLHIFDCLPYYFSLRKEVISSFEAVSFTPGIIHICDSQRGFRGIPKLALVAYSMPWILSDWTALALQLCNLSLGIYGVAQFRVDRDLRGGHL